VLDERELLPARDVGGRQRGREDGSAIEGRRDRLAAGLVGAEPQGRAVGAAVDARGAKTCRRRRACRPRRTFSAPSLAIVTTRLIQRPVGSVELTVRFCPAVITRSVPPGVKSTMMPSLSPPDDVFQSQIRR